MDKCFSCKTNLIGGFYRFEDDSAERKFCYACYEGELLSKEPSPAQKESNGKSRWSLLPFDSLEEVVKVYEYGAEKYDDHNWMKGRKFSDYISAMMRHTISFIRGEDRDKDSNCHHLACVVFYCLALITFTYHIEYDDFDDRIKGIRPKQFDDRVKE